MKNLEFGIPYPVKIGIFNFFLEIRDVVTRLRSDKGRLRSDSLRSDTFAK